MKAIIEIPDDDYTAVRCEGLYYIGHDRLDESVTTAFQNAIPYEEPTNADNEDLLTMIKDLSKQVSELERQNKELWKAVTECSLTITNILVKGK